MDKIYCCECDEEIKEEDISRYCYGCGKPICIRCDDEDWKDISICECCEIETHN